MRLVSRHGRYSLLIDCIAAGRSKSEGRSTLRPSGQDNVSGLGGAIVSASCHSSPSSTVALKSASDIDESMWTGWAKDAMKAGRVLPGCVANWSTAEALCSRV